MATTARSSSSITPATELTTLAGKEPVDHTMGAVDHTMGAVDLELTAEAERIVADPIMGFYGPGSQMWHINREAVLLGAGPAALLLQLAHPLVAEGVAAHSSYPDDAWGRLARTLRTTMDMVFGDGPRAERAVRRLNAVHRGVRGPVLDAEAREVTQRDAYRALDPMLLLWVQSTLIVMSVQAYEAWVGPIDAAARERFWQEARSVGERLGIPRRVSPASWPQLLTWFEEQLAPGGPIVVTETARALAPAIICPPIPWLPSALVLSSALPGLALLPASVRDAYGIRWSGREQRMARWLSVGLRTWVAVMPRRLRTMPQARSADRRVSVAMRGEALGR